MAWIKTQAGILYDCDFVKTHRVFVFGGSGVCEDELGVYNGPEIAKKVLDDIERWIMLGADGVFTMPGKDYAKCGAGFKSYMAAGIDVEKATESILKSCRSVGPVVTTLPIPDSVMHFDFLTHNSKNVVGVSFDRATNIVSVEFGDPSGDQIEKTCRNCGAAGIYCIGCKQGLTNWTPKGGK